MLSQLLITTCWDKLAEARKGWCEERPEPNRTPVRGGLLLQASRLRHNLVFGCAGCRLVASCTVL
jgi:hypothetical protein